MSGRFNELIQASRHFEETFIGKFPTTANRIQAIGEQYGPAAKTLIAVHASKTNIVLTRPVYSLATEFLALKCRYGNEIERKVYTGMSTNAFIKRLYLNRSLAFFGRGNTTVILNHDEGAGTINLGLAKNKWQDVGTVNEQDPLVLKNCLSYEEMQISALMGVAVPTFFINRGDRMNFGEISPSSSVFEPFGIYIGLVGARFENENKMESEYCLITPERCTPENGYGATILKEALQLQAADKPLLHKHIEALRLQLWAKLLDIRDSNGDVCMPTYVDVKARADREKGCGKEETNKYKYPGFLSFSTPDGDGDAYLSVYAYYARMKITMQILLTEAGIRGREYGKPVYLHVVGLGLGVWQVHAIQKQLFVDIFGETIGRMLKGGRISDIAVVDFSWFGSDVTECGGFRHSQRYVIPLVNGLKLVGPEIRFSTRNVADKLDGDYLLVATYAWDSNAFPGNEYWVGSLSGSGDPAAACCSTIAELQNPYINRFTDNPFHIFG